MPTITLANIEQSVFIRKNASAIVKEMHPDGQKFSRIGLTFSKKGWTASIQWDGTSGFRGSGKTQQAAIDDAVEKLHNTGTMDVVIAPFSYANL